METTNMEETDQGIDEFLPEETGQFLRHIPEEVISKVLSGLPIKSLCRFKCVCKSWKSLISDPKFSLITSRGRERAIFWDERTPSFYSLDRDLVLEKLPSPLEKIPDCANQECLFLGSCDGLLLFRVSDTVLLWNPSTRCCRRLFNLNLMAKDYVVEASGLCFDESIREYVVILALFGGRRGDRRIVRSASLSTKIHKRICFPYEICYLANSGITVNGNLHWIIQERKGDPQLIIYFDAKASRFSKLPMPKYNVGDSTHIFGLGVLDGCLSMSRFGNIWNQEHANEILIMREYGVEESWTTLCCLPFKVVGGLGWLGWLPPLFYTKKNKEVLVTNGVHVSVFDLRDKSLRDIHLPKLPNFYQCHMYLESLQKVHPLNPDESMGKEKEKLVIRKD
ncbi:F-box/kelch-repeat protein At3g23880-like [Coffea eugenioides]|uniref:F-box/kelch-repeat protein At3g23880-like n=1 Tax=Coffea eugenioides TaxID=49369 RepID=UPI000F6108F8|nr:F-box/kelch-repeat protein At3g23880-like [Coffea eugenioides]XP_027153586.1 F-box/kelch-repeat protein At3g23880-like [Coffea eugenioides]